MKIINVLSLIFVVVCFVVKNSVGGDRDNKFGQLGLKVSGADGGPHDVKGVGDGMEVERVEGVEELLDLAVLGLALVQHGDQLDVGIREVAIDRKVVRRIKQSQIWLSDATSYEEKGEDERRRRIRKKGEKKRKNRKKSGSIHFSASRSSAEWTM